MEKQPSTNIRKGVILLNFGGPSNLDEVSGFIFQILSDPNTVRLPIPQFLQNRLARRIANKRALIIRKQYQAIGGKSPIIDSTENQRFQLEKSLREQNLLIKVYVMHRYVVGDAENVGQQIIKDQIEDLFLIPLYPHYAWSTVGSSVSQCLQVLSQKGYTGNIQAIRSYPNHHHYIGALSDQLQQTLIKFKLDPQNTRILCSAHGLPQAYVKKGDPYLMELHSTIEELRKRFTAWQFQLCFQSRAGRAQWLKPYTDEVIRTLSQQGVHSILFLPISFVNDHLETLYEIDHTYFEQARTFDLTPHRVTALETHPQFIELLSEQTRFWDQGVQGIDPALLLPPSQQFQRYDQWMLFLWLIAFLITLYFALT